MECLLGARATFSPVRRIKWAMRSLIAWSALAVTLVAPSAGAEARRGSERVEGDGYVAVIKPVGPYRAGQEGAVDVIVTAKSGYHVNEKFPFKVTAEDGGGVTYPKKVMKRDEATIDAEHAQFRLPVVAAKGSRTVLAEVTIGVCTDSQCSSDKASISLKIRVR